MIADHLKDLKASPIREILKYAPKNAINLALGEIRFNTPEPICDKAVSFIKKAQVYYTENAGLKELRDAIAIKYNTNSDSICVTNGAQEALFVSLFSLLNPNDKIMIGDPTFLAYQSIACVLQAEVIKFKFDKANNFSLDKQDFEDKIKLKPKILLITHPSNPTGISFTLDEMNFICQKCKEYNVLLIVDEVYLDLSFRQEIISFKSVMKDSIIISGLSKSACMTGWRLGWIVCDNKDLILRLILSHQFITTCASTISQQAAIEALSVTSQSKILAIKEKLKDNYQLCVKKLSPYFKELNTIYKPDSAPYLFLKTSEVNDIEFVKKLCNNGVIVVPGSAFGDNGRGYFRMSYAIEQDILNRALDILIDFCKINLTK